LSYDDRVSAVVCWMCGALVQDAPAKQIDRQTIFRRGSESAVQQTGMVASIGRRAAVRHSLWNAVARLASAPFSFARTGRPSLDFGRVDLCVYTHDPTHPIVVVNTSTRSSDRIHSAERDNQRSHRSTSDHVSSQRPSLLLWLRRGPARDWPHAGRDDSIEGMNLTSMTAWPPLLVRLNCPPSCSGVCTLY